MKKVTLVLGLFVLLFGCKKADDTKPGSNHATGLNQQALQLKIDNAKVSTNVVTLSIDQTQATNNNSVSGKTVTPHQLMGMLRYPDHSIGLQCNVTQNNGGVHGSFYFNSGGFTFEATPACLQVMGNEAICRVKITKVINDGGLPQYFAVGNYFIVKLRDNGRSANAPAAQIGNLFYVDPGVLDYCLLDWFSVDFGGYSDIAVDGHVDIN